MPEFLVHEGARLEVSNRLLPGVLHDAQLLFNLVVVHQQDALELVVDCEVALAVAIRLLRGLLGGRQVLCLTQLEVVEPGLSNELLSFLGLGGVILDHFHCLWDLRCEVKHAESVAGVENVLLLAQLDSAGELIVPVQEVSWKLVQVLVSPRVNLPV